MLSRRGDEYSFYVLIWDIGQVSYMITAKSAIPSILPGYSAPLPTSSA